MQRIMWWLLCESVASVVAKSMRHSALGSGIERVPSVDAKCAAWRLSDVSGPAL